MTITADDAKSIWFDESRFATFKAHTGSIRHLGSHIGIELIERGADFLSARMPVDERTKMPLGLLHGGASCVLAETLGSVASYLCIDPEKYSMVGLEINANHISSMQSGWVVGKATPIHLGKKTHVWDIRIKAEETDRLVCVSRFTVAILDRPAGNQG